MESGGTCGVICTSCGAILPTAWTGSSLDGSPAFGERSAPRAFSVPIRNGALSLVLTGFLHANRYPLRWKTLQLLVSSSPRRQEFESGHPLGGRLDPGRLLQGKLGEGADCTAGLSDSPHRRRLGSKQFFIRLIANGEIQYLVAPLDAILGNQLKRQRAKRLALESFDVERAHDDQEAVLVAQSEHRRDHAVV